MYKKAVLSQKWSCNAPYGCPDKFWEYLYIATPTATFPEIVNGLLLRLIVLKCTQNLKFIALPVPEIIGGTLGSPSIHRSRSSKVIDFWYQSKVHMRLPIRLS